MSISKSIFCLTILTGITVISQTPDISIALVIDQCAYRNLEKIRPYLKGGLRFLLDEGIVYTQAHTPYAWPSTGPGNATLNTGTLPKEHGIVHNNWGYKPDGTCISCDDDTAENAAVFGPHGLQPYGKSPRHIMVDGLSDQLMMQTKQHKKYTVYAVSLNSKSAICAANKLGKAIWFDPQTGMMTSSKAYFKALPTWLQDFNHKRNAAHRPYTWNKRYSRLPAAYRFKHANNYTGALCNQTCIGKTISPKSSACEPYADFMVSPAANQLIFDAALACIDAHFCKESDEKLFVWILPSAFDALNHMCGPDTIETIDMMYHLDMQLKRFMDCVNKRTCKRNVLWTLTADHGSAPLPEQMREQGYCSAHRISSSMLKERVSKQLNTHFDLENVLLHCDNTALYLNHDLFDNINPDEQTAIIQSIKQCIEKEPGIKKVWTLSELAQSCFQPDALELYYQNQLFKGRSGDFIMQTYPYSIISAHAYGSEHHSPYNYDTHIPLILYQRAYYQRKIVHERVYNTQFAPTMAHILGVPQPSACTAPLLPEIIMREDCCF